MDTRAWIFTSFTMYGTLFIFINKLHEKLFAIESGTNKSLGKKNSVFFIFALRLLVPILQGSVRQISGGLEWTPTED